jgi:hypothetical protein
LIQIDRYDIRVILSKKGDNLMFKMIRFVLALALVTFVGAADAAQTQAPPTNTPKALLQDQEDSTDIYEIPFGTSVDEEKENLREMNDTIKHYQEEQAGKDNKK